MPLKVGLRTRILQGGSVFRILLMNLFSRYSGILRKTPLKRLKWLGVLHNHMYGLLSRSNYIQSGDFFFEVDPRDRIIAKKLELYGSYERCVGSLLLSLAVPGTSVVDVGANIGLHSIPLSRRVGASGQVVAFEPDPQNHDILVRNIRSNNITNISTYKVGLSSEASTALLYQSSINRGGLSLHKENVVHNGEELKPVKIKLMIADEYLRNISPAISLIKIDVEGAEPMVIRGMRDTLRRHTDASIVFEFCPQYIENFGIKPLEFLHDLNVEGFDIGVIDEKTCSILNLPADEILGRGKTIDAALNLLASRNMEKVGRKFASSVKSVGH